MRSCYFPGTKCVTIPVAGVVNITTLVDIDNSVNLITIQNLDSENSIEIGFADELAAIPTTTNMALIKAGSPPYTIPWPAEQLRRVFVKALTADVKAYIICESD